MPLITSDQIRDISVKAVEGFLNNKVPLSEGLAKQASLLKLNSEQIQRSVEATNSIAYLKVLELSSDRTVEFPLCKYAEVMATIAVPEGVIKSAGLTKMDPESKNESGTLDVSFVPDDAEINVHFVKQAALAEAELQALRDRSITIVPELTKVASQVKAESQGLEKLATVSSGKDFAVLSALVYGAKKEHNDIGLFKFAELKTVHKLKDLYKEASELQTAIKEKQAQVDKAALVKEAFLAGAIGRVAEGFGSGLGRVVGGIVSKPLNVLGKGVKNSTMNTVNKAGDFAKKQMGLPVMPRAQKVGIGAVAGGLGMAAMDATMYSPGVNRDTGTSKNVWDALQRQ